VGALYPRKKWVGVSLAFLMTCLSTAASAGGVGVGATRVVYPSDSKQASLAVTNTDTDNAFLIQSWIDNTEGLPAEDFVITPPLFLIKKKSENTLRLIYSGKPLPDDRESLFWINVKSIPSKEKGANLDGKSTLQLAVVSRIKMFYRPKELMRGAREALNKVSVERSGDNVIINNPTPYYVNLIKVAVGVHALENTMMAPRTEVKISVPKDARGEITYSAINDYGAVVKIK